MTLEKERQVEWTCFGMKAPELLKMRAWYMATKPLHETTAWKRMIFEAECEAADRDVEEAKARQAALHRKKAKIAGPLE